MFWKNSPSKNNYTTVLFWILKHLYDFFLNCKTVGLFYQLMTIPMPRIEALAGYDYLKLVIDQVIFCGYYLVLDRTEPKIPVFSVR